MLQVEEGLLRKFNVAQDLVYIGVHGRISATLG